MSQRISVVDVFTGRVFSGNPAAVCRLDGPADRGWMQAVAAETNLPATTFVSPRPDGHHDLRWFTPTIELSVCGHGTLASAHVLGGDATFHTASGVLSCRRREGGSIEMDFPAFPVEPSENAAAVAEALGVSEASVKGAWSGGEWWLVELPDPARVRAVSPDREAVLALGDVVVVAVAAPGDRPGIDSLCRVFEPASGVDEDPATGSAHCVIGPWLAARTGRQRFTGEQASARGGIVGMQVAGDRVVLSGQAVTVLEGALHSDP